MDLVRKSKGSVDLSSIFSEEKRDEILDTVFSSYTAEYTKAQFSKHSVPIELQYLTLGRMKQLAKENLPDNAFDFQPLKILKKDIKSYLQLQKETNIEKHINEIRKAFIRVCSSPDSNWGTSTDQITCPGTVSSNQIDWFGDEGFE